jgi:hypothetical protein
MYSVISVIRIEEYAWPRKGLIETFLEQKRKSIEIHLYNSRILVDPFQITSYLAGRPCIRNSWTCPWSWFEYLANISVNMSGSTADSGSEDVNDFLQRIKELGDRRDQEDEERNKRLEEEILQGRKERQARRAGRSISSLLGSRCDSSSCFCVPG